MAKPAGSATRGIYAVDPQTGKTRRTIVEPSPESDVFGASWSPTGDSVTYSAFDPAGDGIRFRTHLVSADGTGSRLLDPASDVAYDGAQSDWSNDGTRLVVVSGDATDGTGEGVVIMSIAGDAPPVKIPCEPIGDNKCPRTPGSGRPMTPCSSAPCPQMTVRRRTTSPIPRPDGSRQRTGPVPANRTGSDPHPEPTRDAGRLSWPASQPIRTGARPPKQTTPMGVSPLL